MPQSKANPYASKQTVCLNMIVKDESHIIEKTLSHLLEHIPLTYWVICDTGSSDDTCAIIERFDGRRLRFGLFWGGCALDRERPRYSLARPHENDPRHHHR